MNESIVGGSLVWTGASELPVGNPVGCKILGVSDWPMTRLDLRVADPARDIESRLNCLGLGSVEIEAVLGTRRGRDDRGGHDGLGGSCRSSGVVIPPGDRAARVGGGDKVKGDRICIDITRGTVRKGKDPDCMLAGVEDTQGKVKAMSLVLDERRNRGVVRLAWVAYWGWMPFPRSTLELDAIWYQNAQSSSGFVACRDDHHLHVEESARHRVGPSGDPEDVQARPVPSNGPAT